MFKICSFNESPGAVQCPPDDAKLCISLTNKSRYPCTGISYNRFNTYMTDSVTIQSCFKVKKKKKNSAFLSTKIDQTQV